MSSSALASLGLGVLTGDVYKKVLAVVIERDLGPDSMTNQFVLELKSYVAEQSRGGKPSKTTGNHKKKTNVSD